MYNTYILHFLKLPTFAQCYTKFDISQAKSQSFYNILISL
jgi:hypothetical protein